MYNQQGVAITFALYTGDELTHRVTVAEQIIKLGSDPRSHVPVGDPRAARMHAVIEANARDDVTLIDLGNEHGTLVNGARVNKCKLKEGDQLSIGDTRIVVEIVDMARLGHQTGRELAARLAGAVPLPAPNCDNPFTSPVSLVPNPFFAAEPTSLSEGTYEYALLQTGPSVRSEDCETAANDVEIKVRWGRNLLEVAHLGNASNYIVGGGERCHFRLPEDKLGIASAPLVSRDQTGLYALVWPGIEGHIVDPDAGELALQDAIAQGLATPCDIPVGSHRIALKPKTSVTLSLGDLTFEISGVKRGKKVRTLALTALASSAAAYVIGSLVAHAGFIGALTATMPPLNESDNDSISEEQRYFITQALDAIAAKEHEEIDTPNTDDPEMGEQGEAGQRARNEEGKMGSDTSANTSGRWGVKGNADEVRLASRAAMIADAQDFGMIGLLPSLGGGDPDAPTVPWGGLTSEGMDPLSARGNMWGDQIGDSYGVNGLGLTGLGEGGGGLGFGIGITDIGTYGHGTGKMGGFGRSGGRMQRDHKTASPIMRTSTPSVSGRIPPEVIQRIVRQNYGRFRACYESALRGNPSLQGRVSVRFVIGRDGRISNVGAGGDIPDAGVVSCVSRAFYGLSFPQPEGGIVTVSYPIMFTPG